jgi:hypothetical protein
MGEKPTAAMVLSIIGGIFVLLGGAVVAFVGSLISTLDTSGLGLGGGFTVLGVIGIILGLIMIVGGIMISSNPQSHTMWGVIILILSIVSWITSFGGLVIGFILGLIGGILAITFKPTTMGAPYMGGAMTGGMPPQGPTQTSPNMVRCNSCGAMSPMGTTKCPACGASL